MEFKKLDTRIKFSPTYILLLSFLWTLFLFVDVLAYVGLPSILSWLNVKTYVYMLI